MRNLAKAAPPTTEQICAGLLLYTLMQRCECDLGEVEEEADIRDGKLNTRQVLATVVDAAAEGSERGWRRLWSDACDRHTAAEGGDEFGDGEWCLGLAVDSWKDGRAVPVYDRRRARRSRRRQGAAPHVYAVW